MDKEDKMTYRPPPSTTTELQKMLSNELYWPGDSELTQLRIKSRQHQWEFNHEIKHIPFQREKGRNVLKEWFGGVGEDIVVEAPFFADYDCGRVDIGNDVLIAPGVHVYCATHPIDPVIRRKVENSKPVKIGNDVWIGGRAVILPGVTIGENSVIGAGSVVTRDIPANVVAVGNPCRVIKTVEEGADKDREYFEGLGSCYGVEQGGGGVPN